MVSGTRSKIVERALHALLVAILSVSTSCSEPPRTATTISAGGTCTSNADCTDFNACSIDYCDTAAGLCMHPLIPNCCNVNSDCTGGHPCVSPWTCDLATHTCIPWDGLDCCNLDEHCDDGRTCTT